MASLNTIYVYFKGKHQVRSKPQYQYDREQSLYFADLKLPEVFEVHFSNSSKKNAKPQLGRNKKVLIPDEYFWSGASVIYAWVYLHEGKNDGKTVYEVIIPLKERGKPTSDDIEPVQQDIISNAIAELNYAVDQTKEYVDEAEEYKNQSAENVKHYPQVIDGYWSTWDAENDQYVSTGVEAKGDSGLTVFASTTNFIIPVSGDRTTRANRATVELYAYQNGERKNLKIQSIPEIYYYHYVPVGARQIVPYFVLYDMTYGNSGFYYEIPNDKYFYTQYVTCNVVVDNVTFPISLSFNAMPLDAATTITVSQPAVFVPTDANGKLKTSFIESITFKAAKGSKSISVDWDYSGYSYQSEDGMYYQDSYYGQPSSTLNVSISIPAKSTISDKQTISVTAKVSDTEKYTYSICLMALKQGETGEVSTEQLNRAIETSTNDLKQYIDEAIQNAINRFGDMLFENA